MYLHTLPVMIIDCITFLISPFYDILNELKNLWPQICPRNLENSKISCLPTLYKFPTKVNRFGYFTNTAALDP